MRYVKTWVLSYFCGAEYALGILPKGWLLLALAFTLTLLACKAYLAFLQSSASDLRETSSDKARSMRFVWVLIGLILALAGGFRWGFAHYHPGAHHLETALRRQSDSSSPASSRYALSAMQPDSRSSLTRSQKLEPAPASLILYLQESALGKISSQLIEALRSAIAKAPPDLHFWFDAILLGGRSDLPAVVKDDFKRLGIYHLLIISGMHVTMLALAFRRILDLPIQAVYALRLLSPSSLLIGKQFALLASIIAALLFCCGIGFSAAVQRAFCAFLISSFRPLLRTKPSFVESCLLTLCLQSLLFPDGLIDDAALLSWFAYVVAVRIMPRFQGLRAGFRDSGFVRYLRSWIFQMALAQFTITLLVAALFSQFSVLAILVNLILIPVFNLLLFHAVLAIVGIQAGFDPSWFFCQIHSAFLAFVARSSAITREYPALYLELPPDAAYLRIGLLCFAAALLFKLLAARTDWHKCSIVLAEANQGSGHGSKNRPEIFRKDSPHRR